MKMDLGFSMSSQTITTLIIVFVIYSIIVVGLGAYVKYSQKGLSEENKLKNFLTGGGSLGPLSVAMLTFTGMLSAGGAVGGPGTGYSVGFTWSLSVWAGFIFGCLMPFTIGKKIAILAKRTKAVSLISLFRHRFGNSKFYAILLAVVFTIFLGAMTVGQFAGGGKLFAVLTGTGNTKLGVVIFALVTVIYTLTGGIKSISKVAVVQGFVMVITVVMMYVGVLNKTADTYGSVQGLMEYLAEVNPKLVVAETWQPLYMGGTALLMGWCMLAMPTGLVGGLTYNKSKAVLRGGVICIICATVYQFIMSGMGPFTFGLSQTLTSGDYATAFTAVEVLPDALAGLVIAGAASSIQSTIATLLIIVTGGIVVDVYKSIINPQVEDKKLNKLNTAITLIFGVICMIIALKPTQYVQLFINFTAGGMCSALIWPILFGFYNKRANKEAAIASTLGGAITYGALYFAQNLVPSFKAWWAISAGNIHPVVPGVIVSLIFMLVFTYFGKPVEKGRLQVWFCKDYDEEWSRIGK